MDITPALIKEISEELQIGMRCFLHRQTGELVTILTEEGLHVTGEELWQEEFDKIEADPE